MSHGAIPISLADSSISTGDDMRISLLRYRGHVTIRLPTIEGSPMGLITLEPIRLDSVNVTEKMVQERRGFQRCSVRPTEGDMSGDQVRTQGHGGCLIAVETPGVNWH
jgi:hypothetical protein